MNDRIKQVLRKIFHLKRNETLSTANVISKLNRFILNHLFHTRYSTPELIAKIHSLGIGEGCNIVVHSSWDAFSNYEGSPNDLIDGLLKLIGPTGTLAMPCMPLLRKKLFDVRRTVTYAGLLAEEFRKYPGVVRSCNVEHSVCAIGPLANELVCDHQNSKIRFDEHSPYFKMCEHNFQVVTLGLMPHWLGTVIHCVEATMYREIPYFAKFYDTGNPVYYKYIGYDGKEYSYSTYRNVQNVRQGFFRGRYIINRYFDKSKLSKTRLSNLQIGTSQSQYTYNRLCELAKKGVVLYVSPSFGK